MSLSVRTRTSEPKSIRQFTQMPTARKRKIEHRVKTVRARREKLRKRLEKEPKEIDLKDFNEAIEHDEQREKHN